MFKTLLQDQQNKRPLIIAELGAKYTSLDVIKQMIKSSRECGADMVKEWSIH